MLYYYNKEELNKGFCFICGEDTEDIIPYISKEGNIFNCCLKCGKRYLADILFHIGNDRYLHILKTDNERIKEAQNSK